MSERKTTIHIHNHANMVAERSASPSFDRCRQITRFTDPSACEEINPMSAVGDLHATSATGEKFDIWKTGWSLFVLIPKDIQPELVLHDGDKCGPAFLQNVQVSGSMAGGHVRADKAENEGFRKSSSEPLSGTLLQNKILRGIKKNLAKKCLEMLAEIAELKDDYMESYEELGKCLNLGNHENSTVRGKVAELLRLNASALEDAQFNLKEYVDCTKGELNNETIDMPVVRQGRVPTIQPVQKTVEVPQVQFLDRMIDVPIEETKIPMIESQDKIPQRTAEQVMDIPVPQVTEESIEIFNVLSQDRVQQRMVEQITETPAVSLDEKIIQHTIEETIDIPVPHVMKKTSEAVKLIPQERVQNHTVEQFIDMPVVMQRQVQKTVEVPQIQFIDEAVDVPVIVRRQVPIVQKMQKTVEASQVQSTDRVMNALVIMQRHVPAVQVAQKSIVSPAENDHVIQEAERYRDEDKVDKTKIKAKSGLENQCTAMRNTSIVKVLRSKFDVGHTQEARARNRSDKDAQKKANLTNQRQVPAIRSVQKTVEVPRVQYIDKVADIPVEVQRQVSTIQAAQDIDEVEDKMSPRSLRVRSQTSRTIMKTGLSRRARRGSFPCQPRQSPRVAQVKRTLIDSATWSYHHVKEGPSS